MALTISAFKKDESGEYTVMRVGESKDYGHDLTDELAGDSDSILFSNWAVVGSGVLVSSPGYTGGITRAFFTSEQAGTVTVRNTITTAAGRVYVEDFRIVSKT